MEETLFSVKQQKVHDMSCDIFGDEACNRDTVKNAIRANHEIDLVDFTPEMVREFLNDTVYDQDLFKRCIIPPFSILDTRQGEWRKRKNLLDAYLGSSVVGRKEQLTYGTLTTEHFRKPGSEAKINNNTSQFDSVLTELLLKWFGFPGCTVYDSFAGGHIRGTLAALIGYKYIGIELATEQVEANRVRAKELELPIDWINDDSLNVDKYLEDNSADLFFSCPPYGDLEKYTDDPRDLSNMNYADFIVNYTEIIKKGLNKLRDNRFSVFVVGDFRDSRGFYYGFVKDTINIFSTLGSPLYNELILVNNVGTAGMRAGGAFNNRKMVKLHQNVLIFFKGDPATIKENYKNIDATLPVTLAEQGNLFK